MEESIVFDPLIDERSLDREASKVDQRLEQSGTITPDLDDSQLGDIELDGVGGVSGGGGGVGGGEAAGAAALASRIPKPIAGVAVSAAIPVALGGAVGAGMLSAMHSASARLQTSTSMIGQAWSMFWRPFGNRLDELFIRDLATDLLSTMVEFNELAQNEGLVVGLQWLGGKAETAFGNAVGNAVEGALETVGVDLDISGDVSNVLGAIDWPAVTAAALLGSIGWPLIAGKMVMDRIGWPSLPSRGIIGSIDWPTVTAATLLGPIGWPFIAGNMILDRIGWPSLTPGGILREIQWPTITAATLLGPIGWPVIGGGMIMEEVFGGISLDSDDIIDAITGGGNNGDGNGDGDDDTVTNPPEDTREPPFDRTEPPRQPGDPIGGDPTPQPDPGSGGGFIGLQRGGVVDRRTTTTVGEAGAEVVQPLSEFERMIERVAGSTGGEEVDTTPIERKLDRLHRDLRALSDAMASMTIEVDGETLGRATTNARHNKVFDSDSLI